MSFNRKFRRNQAKKAQAHVSLQQAADIDALLDKFLPDPMARRDDGERTYFNIAEDYARDGNPEDLRLMQEYEAAVEGRQKVTWTKGIDMTRDQDLLWQDD